MDEKNQRVIEENAKYRNELRNKEETIEEYAKKQYEQTKKIKLLKSKIELLEKSLG